MVATAWRRALALGLLALGGGVVAPAPAASADDIDPHHPGTSLHGRVFHVPQGARLIWEAWEGARGGSIREVAIDQEQLLDVERAGVSLPSDRAGPGVALVRYVLTVHADAPAASPPGCRQSRMTFSGGSSRPGSQPSTSA